MKFGESIKVSNFYMHMIILSVICQQPCVLVLHFWIVKHSQVTRNQKGNHVNIPTVRTKTSGSNSIKSKSVNTWNDLNKLFIKKQVIVCLLFYLLCNYIIDFCL